MNKFFYRVMPIILLLLSLSGCSLIGDKTANMSILYMVTSVLSLLIFIGYCFFSKKREIWFILLFASIFIVNIGYFALSVSRVLEEALLANRIAYLGSVLLPFSMLMITFNTAKINCRKYLFAFFLIVSVFVFFVAASPGYLNIYYKSVTLEHINGVSLLNKEYGPWHCIYLFYLLGYFAAIIITIVYAKINKKIDSLNSANIILTAVLVNLGVWLAEQIVKIDFEFLSISYVISELFLISSIQNFDKVKQENNTEIGANGIQLNNNSNGITQDAKDQEFAEHCKFIAENLSKLTATERIIYDFYLEGKTTKEIMQQLNITENTLKYHNKNIYSKLWVSSRKQLIEYAKNISSIAE